jgi:NAD(P)H-dependent flavin oxidoreductase YrpB (nitropropane dioxygenase family)
METAFTRLLGIDAPIVQAPIGGRSIADEATATLSAMAPARETK